MSENPCQMDKQRAIDILWAEIRNNQQPLYCTRKELCDAVEWAEESILSAKPANTRFADCHIWEPGDTLDTIADKCEVLIKAADIRALIAQPSTEPLTLEQLRKMGDIPHPVYLVSKKYEGANGWRIFRGICARTVCFDTEAWGLSGFSIGDILAYLRPPERKEETE